MAAIDEAVAVLVLSHALSTRSPRSPQQLAQLLLDAPEHTDEQRRDLARTLHALALELFRPERGLRGLSSLAPGHLVDDNDVPQIHSRKSIPVDPGADKTEFKILPYNAKALILETRTESAVTGDVVIARARAYLPWGGAQWPSGCTCAELAHDGTNDACAAGRRSATGWPSGPCVLARIGRRPQTLHLQQSRRVIADGTPVFVERVAVHASKPGCAYITMRISSADVRLQKVHSLLQRYREYTKKAPRYRALFGPFGKIWKYEPLDDHGGMICRRVWVQLGGTFPHQKWPQFCMCEHVEHVAHSMCPAQPGQTRPFVSAARPSIGSQVQIVMIGSPVYGLFGLSDAREKYNPLKPSRECTVKAIKDSKLRDCIIVDIVLHNESI